MKYTSLNDTMEGSISNKDSAFYWGKTRPVPFDSNYDYAEDPYDDAYDGSGKKLGVAISQRNNLDPGLIFERRHKDSQNPPQHLYIFGDSVRS